MLFTSTYWNNTTSPQIIESFFYLREYIIFHTLCILPALDNRPNLETIYMALFLSKVNSVVGSHTLMLIYDSRLPVL